MKNRVIMALCICFAVSITACSQRDDTKETVQSLSQSMSENSSTTSDQIESEQPASSADDKPSDELDEYGLPVMSKENQQIYDKYFMPLDIANYIFAWSFDKEHFDCFSAIVYSCLARPIENTEVPQDEVEALIMQYFPISAEAIRNSAGIWEYDAEKQTYTVIALDYEYAQNIRGAVVSTSRDGERLTVNCIWNETVYPEDPSTFELLATSTTVIIINSDTEWFYESNQVIRRPPPSE